MRTTFSPDCSLAGPRLIIWASDSQLVTAGIKVAERRNDLMLFYLKEIRPEGMFVADKSQHLDIVWKRCNATANPAENFLCIINFSQYHKTLLTAARKVVLGNIVEGIGIAKNRTSLIKSITCNAMEFKSSSVGDVSGMERDRRGTDAFNRSFKAVGVQSAPVEFHQSAKSSFKMVTASMGQFDEKNASISPRIMFRQERQNAVPVRNQEPRSEAVFVTLWRWESFVTGQAASWAEKLSSMTRRLLPRLADR
ncbi:hypothetical protein C8R45DRAFT_931964 [Mycena sanguinolenta]|nr:hypothetical protein C8R45DRAFT_931964 [Mycena sanguinolenta]